MPHLSPLSFVSFTRRARLLVGAGLAAFVPVNLAWAQQRQVAQMEAMTTLIELGLIVLFLLMFGVILLIARRNMKGWDQPLKWVWFSFSGRLNRKAYWLKGVLLVWMIGLGVQLFGLLVGLLLGVSVMGGMLGIAAVLLVLLPLVVFNIWVGFAVLVKRAHDLGHSGWWLLFFLVPIYNFWIGIVMAFFRGTPGPNDYGPDPIDPVEDYVNAMFGGDDEEGEAAAPTHPRPRPPQGGDEAPKGFGARTFSKPTAPVESEPEQDFAPVEMSGGAANLDVIKRRLGEDIMRPIKRKGGGGRDPEG